MLPKNGRSGISMPSPKSPIIRFSSKGMIFIFECAKSSGRNPARPERGIGVRNGQLDGLDSHFEYIAGFGAFNIDWAGQYVSARAFVGHGGKNLAERRLDLIWLDAGALQPRRRGCDQRMNLNCVSRFDAKRGRSRGVIVSPRDRHWRRL